MTESVFRQHISDLRAGADAMVGEGRGRVEDGVVTRLAQVSWRFLVAFMSTGFSYRLGTTAPCHALRADLGRVSAWHRIRATPVDASKMVG